MTGRDFRVLVVDDDPDMGAALVHAMASPVLDRWSQRGGVPTAVGFGLASGDAIIGNVGSPHYMNNTIIGDAVAL